MADSAGRIVVVGGGFVGLSFGLAASRQGFQVDVHDRRSRPKKPTTIGANVIAVNTTSAAFLQSLGVLGRIDGLYRTPYHSMVVVDGEGTGRVSFSADDADLEELGSIVDQRALLSAMADAADEEEDLAVHWESEFDVHSADRDLLVAADGAHSETREAMGLAKVSWSYHQTATVCTATLETPHERCARQWFLETGPVALLPLGEPSQVAVVWSSFEDLAALDDAGFLERLEVAIESRGIVSTGPRFSFPLIHLQAMRYVKPGVVLLGDAAHAIHPLAGQGANLGFADARALVAELAAARIEGCLPGDLQVLKQYERGRKRDNQLAGLAMEGFHRAFTTGNPLVSLLRNSGLRFVDENSMLKRLAVSVAAGRVL